MNSPFTYRSDPVRIMFGAGAVSALRAEADFHKMSRLVVLCSPSRADIARRQEDAKVQRLAGLIDDRIRDGKLVEGDDSALTYLQQLGTAAPANAATQRATHDLGGHMGAKLDHLHRQ